MEMNEIKQALPQCTQCGRHCPIDATSCPRGQELVRKLMNGEASLADAVKGGGEKEGRHHHGHHHGEHGEHRHQEG